MSSLVQKIAEVNSKISKSWEVVRKNIAAYNGGCVEVSFDGKTVAGLIDGDVSFMNIDDGKVNSFLMKGNESEMEEAIKEEILCFALHPLKEEIVTASRNLLLRHWSIPEKKCIKSIRAHNEVILSLCYERTGTLCASGSADRSVKVWDIVRSYCTHNFIGHTAIVQKVHFQYYSKNLILASSSDDCTIRLWSLDKSKCIAVLKDHLSLAKGVIFLSDGCTLITAGRDQVLNVWDIKSFGHLLTVTIFDPIEAVVEIDMSYLKKFDGSKANLPKKEKSKHTGLIAAVGQKGILYVYHLKQEMEHLTIKISCSCVFKLNPSTAPAHSLLASAEVRQSTGYTHLFGRRSTAEKPFYDELVAVTEDCNFIFYNLNEGLKQSKLIVGFNDTIVDIKEIRSEMNDRRRIAVATNSSQVRIFDADSFSAELLDGHSDIVLALDVSSNGEYMTTVSKDQNGIVWKLKGSSIEPRLLLKGHLDAVSAVCMSKKIGPYSAKKGAFIITGGADKALKKFELNGLKLEMEASGLETIRPSVSVLAHSKDINAVVVSPNDGLVVSVSPVATLTGHKRGVWNAAFSPVDRTVATCSGDRTIRLWSISNFLCIKTFQGHTAAVLNVAFISGGAQLISGGADGLLKLWTIRTSECEGTFDHHSGRIWALTIVKKQCKDADESIINVWRDVTLEHQMSELKQKEEEILKDQSLQNLLREKNFEKAAKLAFELNKPFRLYNVLNELIRETEKNQPLTQQISSMDSDDELEMSNEAFQATLWSIEQLVSDWDEKEFKTCLLFCRDWNTSSKTYFVSQILLTALFRRFGLAKLSSVEGCSSIVDGLIPYSERHFRRLERLLQSTYLVDYTLAGMKMLLPDDDFSAAFESESSDSDAVHESTFVGGKKIFNVLPSVEVEQEETSSNETDGEMEQVSSEEKEGISSDNSR